MSDVVLEVDGLTIQLPMAGGVEVTVVDDLSFSVAAGETVALVGESGAGKSVTGLALLGVLDAGTVSGSIRLGGQELVGMSEAQLRGVRGRQIAMVFQDPMTSLDPMLTVGRQIADVVAVHTGVGRRAAARRAEEMLALVGLPDPPRLARAHPHQLSGGMRQRVMIAMAVACEPSVLVADEPTTALDVTIQAQILEVLAAVQETTGTAILLITHDLGVVAGSAERMVVLYAGREVESGSVEGVFAHPSHPYTIGLLGAVAGSPGTDGEVAELRPITGAPPSPAELPSGCAFHPRCPYAARPDPCASAVPLVETVTSPTSSSHRVACHFHAEIAVGSRRAIR